MDVAGLILALQPVAVGVGKTFMTFLKARSQVQTSCETYNEAWNCARVWLRISEDLGQSLDQRDKEILQRWESKVKTSNVKYYSEVSKHCRRLKIPTSCIAPLSSKGSSIDMPITSECVARDGDAVAGEERGEVRVIRDDILDDRDPALFGRFAFVAVGKSRIKKCAASHEDAIERLKYYCEAFQAFGKSNYIPPAISGTPWSNSLYRFVAKARLRVASDVPVPRLGVGILKAYEYGVNDYVDPRTYKMTLLEFRTMAVTLQLKEGADNISNLNSYIHCIAVDCRGDKNKKYSQCIDDALKLGRFFLDDPSEVRKDRFLSDPDDGDMLRCVMISQNDLSEDIDLIFKVPPGKNPIPRTLRQLLLDTRPPSHPVQDRVKFAIRLATAVLAIHSLGFVHKRVHPEAILVFEPLPRSEQQIFPYRLGYPYLAAFQFARLHDKATRMDAFEEDYQHHSIYFHPRDQGKRRMDEFRMKDDIYSLGVCLFEIALWRSLLIWDETKNDYVYDHSFIPLYDDVAEWNSLKDEVRAMRSSEKLIEAAKRRIPGIIDKDFSDVVVACLCAGYDDSPIWDVLTSDLNSGDSEAKPLSLTYLEVVLSKLRRIHKRLGAK